MTSIRTGDRFAYDGLTGQGVEERQVEILGIDVEGTVSFRTHLQDIDGTNIRHAPLTQVLAMVRQGIWRPLPDDTPA